MSPIALQAPIITFGCDPEIFFSKEGKVIGAEKIFEDKLTTTYGGSTDVRPNTFVVLDGVQAEINPGPGTCRQGVGSNIAACFNSLYKKLQSHDGVNISFEGVVKLDKKELDSLSEKARVLGCAPSLNYYDSKATISVDPKTYRKRSAGGHIHMGLDPLTHKHREELVPLLDILVGNTGVLLDRDPEAAERRKVYGRTGEYRLPKHGLEYRTLSNFWLRNFKLMHLMMGLCRMVVAIKEYDLNNSNKATLCKDLLSLVKKKDVVNAINENNVDLALENFHKIKGFIKEVTNFTTQRAFYYYDPVKKIDQYTLFMEPSAGPMGLSAHTIEPFEFFVKKVLQHGMEWWFPQDPVAHWLDVYNNGVGWGMESFLHWHVRGVMAAEESGEFIGADGRFSERVPDPLPTHMRAPNVNVATQNRYYGGTTSSNQG